MNSIKIGIWPMNIKPQDLKIVLLSTAMVLLPLIGHSILNPVTTDQVYRITSFQDRGETYLIEGSMFMTPEGERIEYNDNFKMPLGRRAIKVKFKIPKDSYIPVEGEYMHVKREKTLNRVKVVEVGKINYTDSVFGLRMLD